MLTNLSKTKVQVILVIAIVCVAILAYVLFVAKGLENPQVNCEDLRMSAAVAVKEQHLSKAEQLLKAAMEQATRSKDLRMLGTVQSDLAEVYERENKFAQCELCLRETLDCWSKMPKTKLQANVNKAFVDVQIRLANALEKQGKTAEAVNTYQSILSELENDENGLRTTVFARFCDLLGRTGMKKELTEAQDKEELLNGGASYAEVRFYAGVAAARAGDLNTATLKFQQALILAKKWELFASQIDALDWLACVQLSQNKIVEAEGSINQALKISKSNLDKYDNQLFQTLWLAAWIRDLKGEKKSEQALVQRIHGAKFNTLVPLLVVGENMKRQNRPEDSLRLRQALVRFWENANQPLIPEMAGLNFEIAADYSLQNKYDESNSYFERAIHQWELTDGPKAPQITDSLGRIALNYSGQGRVDQALDYQNRALANAEKYQGPNSIQTGVVLQQIGQNFALQKKYEESNRYLFRALPIGEKIIGPNSKEVGQLLQQIGQNYYMLRQYDQCRKYYDQAERILEAATGIESKQVAILLMRIGDCLEMQKEIAERDEVLLRAEKILENISEPVLLKQKATIEQKLAREYEEKGQHSESTRLLKKSLDSMMRAKCDKSELDALQKRITESETSEKSTE